MSLTQTRIGAAHLLAALTLIGCGSGSGAALDRLAGQGMANGALPANAEFIARAQAASCADLNNRLFMIDRRMVFWDRAGHCADNAYGRTLYGMTPQVVLYSVSDSIAGPRSSCLDAQSRALFDVIVANLDKGDLGLGSSHQVEALFIPPKPAPP